MSKKTNLIIYILLGAVLLFVIITAAVLIGAGSREAAGLEDQLHGLSDELSERDKLVSALEGEGASLERTVEQLENEIAALKNQIERLKAEAANSESLTGETMTHLNKQLAEKADEIAALRAEIEKYSRTFNVDILAQSKMLDLIFEYINTQSPYVKMEEPPELDAVTGEPIEKDPDAEPVYVWVAVADLIEEERAKAIEAGEEQFLPETKEAAMTAADEAEEEFDGEAYDAPLTAELRRRVLAREDIVYPTISLYYEDLSTGYRFDYQADIVYDPASVVKAPYILSILQSVSSADKKYLDSLAAKHELPERIDINGDGVPDTEKIEYADAKLNLYDKVVWNKATMMKDGSGKIQSMPDGTEFTYLDFVKYALMYSDNVAYQQLKDRFGYSRYYSLAARSKATTAAKNANQMTARDAGLLFKAIYEFIEEDERYGTIMAEAMRVANHTVIVPLAVSPVRTYHKYGWDKDAYHDAAIVMYSDKPYVVTVFTNMDNGGNDVNAYLQGLVKLVHQLHKGFYAG